MVERDGIGDELVERVLERLGLEESPENTLEGLDHLYGAWCREVPFDNLRKLIALHSDSPSTVELPGIRAEDFFQNYLEHSCGGTCWPSSNALFNLLVACGFDARRVSASMLDSGIHNHGTIIVRLPETEPKEWLVDSSILSSKVLPLEPSQERLVGEPMHTIRIEPHQGSFRIWWRGLQAEPMPCRLLDDPVDYPFYWKRYEVSRNEGAFNQKLCVHRYDGERNEWMLAGARKTTSIDGDEESTFEPAEARRVLIDYFGYSPELVGRLSDSFLAEEKGE